MIVNKSYPEKDMSIVDLTREEVAVLIELLHEAIDTRTSVECSDNPFAVMSKLKQKLEG